MSEPIHLDTLDVIEKARAAHAYGLLTAQAPDIIDRRPAYECMGRVCAIGASIGRVGNYNTTPISMLMDWSAIDGDRDALTQIQVAHDTWASLGGPNRADLETAFLRTLSEVGGRHG